MSRKQGVQTRLAAMGDWYTIGLTVGLGVALGTLFAGLFAGTAWGRIAAVALGVVLMTGGGGDGVEVNIEDDVNSQIDELRSVIEDNTTR